MDELELVICNMSEQWEINNNSENCNNYCCAD